MTRLADALAALAVTAWVGALWAIGLIAAPTLFDALQDRSLAGLVAGRLFLYVAVLGFVCGAYLVVFWLARLGGEALRRGVFWVVLLMLVLAAIGEFAVHPILDSLKDQALAQRAADALLRSRFAAWHGVASVLYLVQCALGAVLVVRSQ
jgi:uncharacterized membrane protein